MESLLASRRVSLQALRVPFTTLPKNMRRRFSNLAEDTLFEFYHTTEEQWFDLLQSLEADEILTSQNTTTSDFVISTLEHHQVQSNDTKTNKIENNGLTLSLRKNRVNEKKKITEIANETLEKEESIIGLVKELSKEEQWENSITKQQEEEEKAKEEEAKVQEKESKQQFVEKRNKEIAQQKMAKIRPVNAPPPLPIRKKGGDST